jgi:hypothetical protein
MELALEKIQQPKMFTSLKLVSATADTLTQALKILERHQAYTLKSFDTVTFPDRLEIKPGLLHRPKEIVRLQITIANIVIIKSALTAKKENGDF